MHVLAINETKLDNTIDDNLVNIDGYTIKRCDGDRNGGGVAGYLKDTLLDKFIVREDIPKSFLELSCIEIKLVHAAPILVMAWYRHPNVTADPFDHLEECLQFLDMEDKEIVHISDTNCYVSAIYSKKGHVTLNNTPADSLHLLEIYNLFGLHQLIISPSCETLTTTTLIDHIDMTNDSNIVNSGMHETPLSNHYLIYCVGKFWGTSMKQHKHISTKWVLCRTLTTYMWSGHK